MGGRMRIIDSTIFCNEYDVLELRLSEHYDHVDKFVIVESDKTFTGVYKGYNLEANKDRFSKWWDKIQYIKAEQPNLGGNSWTYEGWQRDQLAQGWTDLGDNDVIIMSDVDEIMRPEALQFVRDSDYGYYEFFMPISYFKLNYIDTNSHYSGWGKAMRGYQTNGESMRYLSHVPNKSRIKLHHAGWHFSWLGDEEFIKNKIQSFAHTEYNVPSIIDNLNIEKHIEQGRDHLNRPGESWRRVKLDNYFPKTVLSNLEKYQKYIVSDGDKSVQDYWTKQILEQE
jgi:hypothetical protein